MCCMDAGVLGADIGFFPGSQPHPWPPYQGPYWLLWRCHQLAPGQIFSQLVQSFMSWWTFSTMYSLQWCSVPWYSDHLCGTHLGPEYTVVSYSKQKPTGLCTGCSSYFSLLSGTANWTKSSSVLPGDDLPLYRASPPKVYLCQWWIDMATSLTGLLEW